MESEKKRARDRKREDSLLETDLANEKMGNNQLQGNDRENVRNQRHAVPDTKLEPEEVIESFENLDPKVRSERWKKARLALLSHERGSGFYQTDPMPRCCAARG